MRVARHKVTVSAVAFLFAFCSSFEMSFAQDAPPAPDSGAAAAAAAAPAGVNVDLSSTTASVTFAADNAAATPVNINMAGVVQTVNPGQMITPAQAVAAYQMMNTGAQSIILGAMGDATGGTMNISPWLAANMASLVIPSGVSVINNFANNPALSLAGSLTNAGTFYAVSTNPAVSTASIAALNIANQLAALMTSILPTGGLPGYANAISNLNLSLSAINNIMNAGVISSAGTLSMTAGGTITNASNMAGISAVMQAMNNVNLNAASVVNSGLISSITGNINIASQLSGSAAAQALQALNVNNVGGIMQALNGNINVGSMGNTNISLYGGNWLSKALNVNAGLGSVTASLGQLTGALCVQAGAAHVYADTSVLKLGNTKIEGDPTFVSTGDIELNGDVTAAQSLSLIAQGNIYIPSPASVSISTTGTNSDITLIAGATVSCAGCPTGTPIPTGGGQQIGGADQATVTFTAANGGYINLGTNNNLSSGPVIDASASSGNVTLAAYSNGTDTGWIYLPSIGGNGDSIKTAGDGTGAQGNVTIIAGGTLSANNLGVQTGNIETSNSGAISVTTAQPVATSLVYSSDGTHTGTLAPDATIVGAATVTLGDLTTDGANAGGNGQNGGTSGQITVDAGGAIEIGTISGNGGNGSPGAIGGQNGGNGGDGSIINLTSQTASILVGTIIANGGNGAIGGLGAPGIAGGTGGAGGNGGNGGLLFFTANTSITAGAITADAGDGEAGAAGGDATAGTGGTGGAGGNGGLGGTIDFVAGTFISATSSGVTLQAQGGVGGIAGNGGSGGSIVGLGGIGGNGGNGGCVCLSAGTSLLVGAINVNGNQGGLGGDSSGVGALNQSGAGGIGGDGGSVTLTAVTTLDSANIDSIGGIAGNPGIGGAGGPSGSVGGAGGFIDLESQGDIGNSTTAIGNITSSGGNGSVGSDGTAFNVGGTGGAGGAAGNIIILANNNIFASDITSSGGVGGVGGSTATAGNGGQGGLGGDVTLTSSVSGSIQANSVSSFGGNGGNAGSGLSGGTGGAGGASGAVEITTTIGQVSGMTINSIGGGAGSAGSNAGNGGNGGNAGTVQIVAQLAVSQVVVFADGGAATNGGQSSGFPGDGGNGGNAGAVTITVSAGSLDSLTLTATAGDGGVSGFRTNPGVGGVGGLGGNGSNINIFAATGIADSSITARAGVGGGISTAIATFGGDGLQGNVALTTNGAVSNTSLNGSTVSGAGFGTNFNVTAGTSIELVSVVTSAGHQAGNVNLLAGTFINFGSINASGLVGRTGSASLNGTPGGSGGNVSIVAGTDIATSGSFTISTNGGLGGNGGAGSLTIGFQSGGNGAQGGRAGNITLSALGNIGNSAASGGYIIANGGTGGDGGDGFASNPNGSGGNGGQAGTISLISGGNVGGSLGGFTATGGNGGAGLGNAFINADAGNGGAGGNGGIISIRAAGDIGNTATTVNVVDVSGGVGLGGAPSSSISGNGGAGGNGGFINLYSGGTINASLGEFRANAAAGGAGGTGGTTSIGGSGANGGNGGIIQLFALGGLGTVAAPLQNAIALAGAGGAGGFDCCPPSSQHPSGTNGVPGYLLFAAGGSDGINFGSSGAPASLTGGSITFVTGFGSNPTITKVMPTNGAYTVGAFDLFGTGITINGTVLAANPITAVQNTAGTTLNITNISGDSVAFSVTAGVGVGTGTITADPSVTNLSGVGTGAPAGQDLLVFSLGDISDNGTIGEINQSPLAAGFVGGQIVIVSGSLAGLFAGNYGNGTGVSPFLTLTESPTSPSNTTLGDTALSTNSNLIFLDTNFNTDTGMGALVVSHVVSNGSQPGTEGFNGLPGGTLIAAANSADFRGDVFVFGGAGALSSAANTFGGNGAPGGLISVTTRANFIFRNPVIASGGAGAGGTASTNFADIINGGAGGAGGIILLSSTAPVTLAGSQLDDIFDASGAGGGGGAAYSVASSNGGAGGIGGAGGLISMTVNSPLGLTVNGTLGAASGGNGGNGGTSNGTGSGGGGGGGGSLGEGGVGGQGGQGSSTGVDGDNGNEIGGPGVGGAGGAAGAVGSTNGADGLNAGFGFNPGGQITLLSPKVEVLGVMAPGQFVGSSVVAAGANGQVTVGTWATLSDPTYATNANYGIAAPTFPLTTINPGVLTTTGNIVAGGSNNSSPISINGTSFSSPYAAGTTTGLAQITITESGLTYTLTTGSTVTPAELIAAIQVSGSASQQQPLTLLGTGAGTGWAFSGSFDVNPENYPVGGFSSLTLPGGVTANFNIPTADFIGANLVLGTMNFSTDNTQMSVNGTVYLGGAINFNSVSTNTLQVGTFNIFGGGSIFSNGVLNIAGRPGLDLAISTDGTASIGVSLSTGTNVNISVDPGKTLFFNPLGGPPGPRVLNLQAGSIATPVQITADTVVISPGFTINGGTLTNIGFITNSFTNNGSVIVDTSSSPCCLIGVYPAVTGQNLSVNGTGTYTADSTYFGLNPFAPSPANQALVTSIAGTHTVTGLAGLFGFDVGGGVGITAGSTLTADDGIYIDAPSLGNLGTLTETSGTGIYITDQISGSGITDNSTGIFNTGLGSTTYDIFGAATTFTATPTYNGFLSIFDNNNSGVVINGTATLTATAGDGTIAVVSDPGFQLSIDGIGTFRSNRIVLTATSGDLALNGAGTLTFEGTSILTATAGSVTAPFKTLAHGGFGVTINSPDTFNPIDSKFDPPSGITRNATGTAPSITSAAITIVTDPLILNGTLVGITAVPPAPTPSGGSTTQNNNNNNSFVFPTLTDNSQNSVIESISTRLPTDNTMVLPPGETTEVTNPINPLTGHANKFNESAIEATIVNTSEFTPEVLTSLNQSGLTHGSHSGNSYYNLDRGSAIFTPENGPIVVGTHECDVHIEQGSAVHVYETGHDVSILNLDDRRKGAVKVVAGGKLIIVQPGKALVLTRVMQADYDKVNPLPSIATRHTQKIELENGITAFVSDFSILSALMRVVPLKQLVNSNDPKERQLAHALLKNALLITNFSAMTSGPYKSTQ